MSRAATLAVGALAACTGETGVIRVALATSPGSTLLDGVQTLRVELTSPRTRVTAERDEDGFAIDLEVAATGATSALLVEGLGSDGALIASGATPAFEVGAVTGRVVVFMAAPNSVGEAPVALAPARDELGVASLPYGAVFAGGRLASGAASDAVAIYNTFDHSLTDGLAMPAPRRGLAVGAGALGVYLFGGRDVTGTITGGLWRFDPQSPPAGSYFDFGDRAELARADQHLVATASDRFLVTGTPAAELSGLDGQMAARRDVTSLPAPGATVIASDGVVTSVFADGSQVVRCRAGTCAALEVTVNAGGVVVPLPGGAIGVVCGGADLVRIDAASGAVDTVAGVPSTVRTGCAAAATSRHLIVAGGRDASGLSSTVEIFDVTTLSPIALQPLVVPRAGASALPLANEQVLIAGGVDSAGAPIATLELFTPPARGAR